MKIRTNFVTNSSSTSYILIGDSFNIILAYLTKYRVFDSTTSDIVNVIERDGIEKLEIVFNTGEEIQNYIEDCIKSFEKLVKFDKNYYTNTEDSYSKNFVKVLKKEVVLDVEHKVGLIVEVGDNHGTFLVGGWVEDDNTEFSARRELDCSAGLDKDVIGFWESNR